MEGLTRPICRVHPLRSICSLSNPGHCFVEAIGSRGSSTAPHEAPLVPPVHADPADFSVSGFRYSGRRTNTGVAHHEAPQERLLRTAGEFTSSRVRIPLVNIRCLEFLHAFFAHTGTQASGGEEETKA